MRRASCRARSYWISVLPREVEQPFVAHPICTTLYHYRVLYGLSTSLGGFGEESFQELHLCWKDRKIGGRTCRVFFQEMAGLGGTRVLHCA